MKEKIFKITNKRVIITLFLIALLILIFNVLHYDFTIFNDRIKSLNTSVSNWKSAPEIYCENKIEVLKNIWNSIGNFFRSIVDFFKKSNEEKKEVINNKFMYFWRDFFIFLKRFLEFMLNFVVNLLICLYAWFSFYLDGEVEDIYTSKFGKVYLKYRKIKHIVISFLKRVFITCKNWILNHKLIFASVLIVAFLPQFAYFVFEFIIALIVYVVRTFQTKLHIFDLSVIGSVAINIILFYLSLPFILKIAVIVGILFFIAYYRALKKLRKNYNALKTFVKYDLTQTTIINGKPGKGKTLSLTQFALASCENFQDDLESYLSGFAVDYPDYNFAELELRINDGILTDDDWEEFGYYIMIYMTLYFRKSMLFSNYSINDVYHNKYCKMLKKHDLEMGVFNKDESYDLEEYIVIAISEFDKFCNSHDKGKEYFDNGVNIFFSTISHALNRNVKVFVDYQQKDQVAKMCRGNAEWFLTIEDKISKYPLMLRLFRIPFDWLLNYFSSRIEKFYYKKRPLFKRSNRFSIRRRKRSDYTGVMSFYRYCQLRLSKICSWFDEFYYYKMISYLGSDDNPYEQKCKFYLNQIELSDENKERLYHSTYLSPFYDYMRSNSNGSVENRKNWSGLVPTVDELKETGLYDRFFTVINEDEEPTDDIEEF